MRSGHYAGGKEGNAPGSKPSVRWRRIALAAAVAALACQAAYAKDSDGLRQGGRTICRKGKSQGRRDRAAQCDPRVAARSGSARAARRCLSATRRADAAEREARSALERNGDEADYLSVLMDALLRQDKFAELLDLVEAGRPQSGAREQGQDCARHRRRGTARPDKAEKLLREAINLDPNAAPAQDPARAAC